MPETRTATGAAARGDSPGRLIFGLTRQQRFRIYRRGAALLAACLVVWAWLYLRPYRWYKYTDQVAFEQVARDVRPGFVAWEAAGLAGEGLDGVEISQPAASADGVRLVYSAGGADGDANLFLRRWDGTSWGPPRPLRALNSRFHETAPAFSGDGGLLYFVSDRPGGRGGRDIWVARWDGAEYAWPLPLTARVNTGFDEIDPAVSPDGMALYFSSNRPRRPVAEGPAGAGNPAAQPAAADFDLYAADIADETPFELLVERRLSMLYSLREGALADPAVMAKLGGTPATEAAVDKGLAFLAGAQETDGRWNIARHGGQGGHDVAATAFSLLAFYGRGERHDQPCRYRDSVARGLQWLLAQQNPATGDLRGQPPAHNGMYDHGAAALALVEAYGVTKDPELRPKALAAIEFIGSSQHAEGGWRYQPGERGDLSVTGWMVMTLASARMSGIPVPEKTLAGAAAFLRRISGGEHGGSYGYTDSPGKGNSGRDGMNAAGFFCAQLAGASPNNKMARESAAIIGAAGFKRDELYYAYYGTLAAYQHQGGLWRGWIGNMQRGFLESQQPDGSWQPGGQFGGPMGRVVGTALTLLCLEAHYRYTPLYGLGFEPDPDGPAADVPDEAQLPPPPDYRHAKLVEALSSPADDTGPVPTDHGDFLYFSSTRPGGLGGADIFRARISGPAPGAPVNLGREVNSAADDTDPAVRMAGFHLLFNSTRTGAGSLHASMSRRLARHVDVFNLPPAAWWLRNLPWLIGVIAGGGACAWLARRAAAAGRKQPQPSPPPPAGDTATRA